MEPDLNKRAHYKLKTSLSQKGADFLLNYYKVTPTFVLDLMGQSDYWAPRGFIRHGKGTDKSVSEFGLFGESAFESAMLANISLRPI